MHRPYVHVHVVSSPGQELLVAERSQTTNERNQLILTPRLGFSFEGRDKVCAFLPTIIRWITNSNHSVVFCEQPDRSCLITLTLAGAHLTKRARPWLSLMKWVFEMHMGD